MQMGDVCKCKVCGRSYRVNWWSSYFVGAVCFDCGGPLEEKLKYTSENFDFAENLFKKDYERAKEDYKKDVEKFAVDFVERTGITAENFQNLFFNENNTKIKKCSCCNIKMPIKSITIIGNEGKPLKLSEEKFKSYKFNDNPLKLYAASLEPSDINILSLASDAVYKTVKHDYFDLKKFRDDYKPLGSETYMQNSIRAEYTKIYNFSSTYSSITEKLKKAATAENPLDYLILEIEQDSVYLPGSKNSYTYKEIKDENELLKGCNALQVFNAHRKGIADKKTIEKFVEKSLQLSRVSVCPGCAETYTKKHGKENEKQLESVKKEVREKYIARSKELLKKFKRVHTIIKTAVVAIVIAAIIGAFVVYGTSVPYMINKKQFQNWQVMERTVGNGTKIINEYHELYEKILGKDCFYKCEASAYWAVIPDDKKNAIDILVKKFEEDGKNSKYHIQVKPVEKTSLKDLSAAANFNNLKANGTTRLINATANKILIVDITTNEKGKVTQKSIVIDNWYIGDKYTKELKNFGEYTYNYDLSDLYSKK